MEASNARFGACELLSKEGGLLGKVGIDGERPAICCHDLSYRNTCKHQMWWGDEDRLDWSSHSLWSKGGPTAKRSLKWDL